MVGLRYVFYPRVTDVISQVRYERVSDIILFSPHY